MIRNFVIILFLGLMVFPLTAVSSEPLENKESYNFEGFDFTVSEVGANCDDVPIIDVNLIVNQGQKMILDETIKLPCYHSGTWVRDFDLDHNPEIIFLVTQGKAQYADIILYEINKSELTKYDFPELTKEQQKGYRGRDHVSIFTSYINRGWGAYKESDPECCPTGDQVNMVYRFNKGKVFVESYERK